MTSAKLMRGRIFKTQPSLDEINFETPSYAVFALRSVSKEYFGSYLVDPASSHMLVSKIKPCMSKYKYCTAKLQTAH